MDTWQNIQCEDIYEEREDTSFLNKEQEAWEEYCLEQVNLELTELADQPCDYEIV